VTERPNPATFDESNAMQTIYFDFDRYDIRPGDAKVLEADAAWLKSNDMRVLHPGSVRRTRHRRIQPGARRAPGPGGHEFPHRVRHLGRSHHDDQLRQGTARLRRAHGGVLGPQPARALRGEGAGLIARRGAEGRAALIDGRSVTTRWTLPSPRRSRRGRCRGRARRADGRGTDGASRGAPR